MVACSQEQVALYINGDLTADEARGVEAHLQDCAACRRLAGALRADVQSVEHLVAHTPPSTVGVGARATPTRPWIPAAAVALLMALLLGVITRPVLAGGIRQAIHWLTVHRLSEKPMADYLDGLNARLSDGEGKGSQGVPVAPLLVTTQAQDAERAAGFPVLTPAYIPDGFELKEIWVWPGLPDQGRRSMQQVYRDGTRATLTVAHAPVEGSAGTVTAPEEDVREVDVGDSKGLLVYGALRQEEGSSYWVEGPVTLRFYHRGEAVRITVTGATLSDDELIRVASSIP